MLTKGEAAFLTVLVGGLIIMLSPDLPALPHPASMECNDHGNADNQYCRALAGVGTGFDRIVGILERNDKAILAVGTLAIAWFTFVLWQSTHFLWKAGERQINVARDAANAATLSAKAAIGIELPVIRMPRFPGRIALTGPPTASDFGKGGVITHDLPGQYSLVVGFAFQNLGRTPAVPSKLEVGWKVASVLPSGPVYFSSVPCAPTAIMLPNGGEFEAARIQKAMELTVEERGLLGAGEALLWLYVSIHYRDFLDQAHEARFCWSGRGGFARATDAPPAYTAHT